jgi:hypothetical protein
MEETPFFVVITKPNKQKIQNKIVTDTGKTLNDIRNRIIYLIQEEINVFKDLPIDFDEFIYKCWYKDSSADAEPFEYKIFNQGKWSSPWSIEDLYSEACEIIHKLELINGYVEAENYPDEEIDENEENEIA